MATMTSIGNSRLLAYATRCEILNNSVLCPAYTVHHTARHAGWILRIFFFYVCFFCSILFSIYFCVICFDSSIHCFIFFVGLSCHLSHKGNNSSNEWRHLSFSIVCYDLLCITNANHDKFIWLTM